MHILEYVSQNMCKTQTTFEGSVLILPLDFQVWGLCYQAQWQASLPTEHLSGAELCLKEWSLEIGLLALTSSRPGAMGKSSCLKPIFPHLVIKACKHGMLGIVSGIRQPSCTVQCSYLKLWLSHRFTLILCSSVMIATLVNRISVYIYFNIFPCLNFKTMETNQFLFWFIFQ